MSMIELKPAVLRWARERASLDIATLAKKIGAKVDRVAAWEQTGQLTFKQAEGVAHHTHTPFGQLFLANPLEDKLPIPDFRTLGDKPLGKPTPELLDTVQTMQRRLAWMHDYLLEEGQDALPFVGRFTLQNKPADVAADMLKTLGLERDWAKQYASWEAVLVELRHRVDNAGILIFINGVVGNNTHRKLNVEEFRGFALCDRYAPLIFINGSDAKAAQMFTLAHELAHLWIGQDAVSNFTNLEPGAHQAEQFCNKVAAEFLMPEDVLRGCWDEAEDKVDPFQYLARRFRVSPLVAARRALDMGLIQRTAFFSFYRDYQDSMHQRASEQESGGNFWNTQHVRVGERFGAAVVRAALEGRLLFREAYMLVGMRGATFDKFAKELGYGGV